MTFSRALLSFLALALFLFAPLTSFGAQSATGLRASTTTGNVYAAAGTIVRTVPVLGDYTAVAGTLVLAGSVANDALLLAGSINSRATISGDMRAAGGTITISQPILGDLVVLGVSVHDAAPVGGNVLVAAGDVALDAGAVGPVSIYANTVTLGGTYDHDVHVVSSGRITLASSTVIHGSLTYEAPEKAEIPSSAVISGGIVHQGSSFFPNADASRFLALASMVIFILVRILGALILAGLLAGLFPRLAEALSRRAHSATLRSILLTTLLGFAAFATTPILLVLLALTFVGFGIALLMGITYALLILLAFVYAGILVGAAIARRFGKRETVLWRDGVIGILLLSLAAFVPLVGWIVVALLTLYTAGALLLLFFRFAFPQPETRELLY